MKAKGIFFTVLSALLFGVCPVLSSKTYQMGSNPLTLTFYREAMVLPLLLVTLLARRISLRVTWRELLALSLVGVLCRGATTLHFMYPVFVALLCRGLFRERLGRAKVLALVLASAGVVLFLERGGGSNALLGMALALCSGVTYAAFMVAVGKTSLSRMDPFLVTFYSAAAVAAGVLLADIPLGQLVFRLPPKAFFYTFLIAVGSSYAAVILLQIGVRYLSATTAAVFSLFEPVSCSIAGAVWLGETFTLQKLLGSVIILGAAGLLAAAKPEVSPDSQEALALLMSPEGFPHPPEPPEEETAAEK